MLARDGNGALYQLCKPSSAHQTTSTLLEPNWLDLPTVGALSSVLAVPKSRRERSAPAELALADVDVKFVDLLCEDLSASASSEVPPKRPARTLPSAHSIVPVPPSLTQQACAMQPVAPVALVALLFPNAVLLPIDVNPRAKRTWD